jgi:hypothetical protein
MSGTVRRVARSQPVPWRRMVFGLLLVLTLVAPIALGIVIARGAVEDLSGLQNLIRLWTVATMALLIWSAIYVRDEPALVRIVVSLLALFLFFIMVRGRLNAPQNPSIATSPTPATGTTPHEVASSSKVDKKKSLAEALIGKWKLANHTQTMEFRSDQTKFFVTTDAGQNLEFGYKVHDATHLDVWLPQMPPDADPISWAFTLANENELTVQTKPNATPVSYTRVR